MSNTKKTVRISESDLINLIDNIVTEAVLVKKQEWISEQTKKNSDNTILEQKLAKLEAKVNGLTAKK
jgi:hypothetical protein